MLTQYFLSKISQINLNLNLNTSENISFARASLSYSFYITLKRSSAKTNFVNSKALAEGIVSKSLNRGSARGAAGKEGIYFKICKKF